MLFSFVVLSHLSFKDSVSDFCSGGSIVLSVVLFVMPEVVVGVVEEIFSDVVDSEACALSVDKVVAAVAVDVVDVADCSDEEGVEGTGDAGGVSSFFTCATLNSTCDNWDATYVSKIWLITNVSNLFSQADKIREFAGTRERCTNVLADLRTISKLVPISSGFSFKADTPCIFATFMAADSASSINDTNKDTQPFCIAITLATPESAAEK